MSIVLSEASGDGGVSAEGALGQDALRMQGTYKVKIARQ